MLFNSYTFLFGLFPITLLAFFVSRRFGSELAHVVLLAASLGFYAWWDIRFIPLLVGSFSINYLAALVISRNLISGGSSAGRWLAAAVIVNLAILAVFKYASFALTNINLALGTDFALVSVILPLGISFFTFEQISFLVDVRRGHTRPSLFLHYALFVSFFPRLVAGPILRYNEIAPQFARPNLSIRGDDLAVGLTIFFIGLLKKAVLADGIAPYATPVFAAAERGEALDLLIAWGGALAYACQLYFDFSGYSDMAIGAARCFGIRFPENFNSPYKSTSIIEFWRRWHMTLSRFLRDYLYFALGGNRRGPARRYCNLMITMLLGGFWHGANWTFIVWGGLHGMYLIVIHGWLALVNRWSWLAAFRGSRVGASFGLAVTFLAVVVAWVFFRSPTFAAAFNLLGGMVGLHGVVIPAGLEFAFAPVHGLIARLGIRFADTSGTVLVMTYVWTTGLLAIAFLAPNTQQILARAEPVLWDGLGRAAAGEPMDGDRPMLRWQLSPAWAIAIGVIAFLGIISMTHVSEFLYWQF